MTSVALDTQFALASAATLEDALGPDHILAVGQAVETGLIEALDVTSTAFTIPFSGDEPGCVALVVSGGLAALLADLPAGSASVVDAALRAAAAAYGCAISDEHAHEVDVADAQGAPGSRLTTAPLLEGSERVAVVAVRVGPDRPGANLEPDTGPHNFPILDGQGAPEADVAHPLSLLNDVELGVTVELGRTRILLRDLLALTPGAVIELDRAAGSPVDMLVNGTLIARGEVVVVDEEFGIRVTEIVGHGYEGKRTRR